MYTLESAAVILGKSQPTIRRWMKEYNIKGVLITTDNTRRYLSEEELFVLIEHINRKIPQYSIEKSMLAKYAETPKSTNMTNIIQEYEEYYDYKLYSLPDAALFLNVAVGTLKNWIRKHHIEKIKLTTNRSRVYISQQDVFTLAQQHPRKKSATNVLDIPQEIKDIKSLLQAHAAAIEDIKHDLRIYIKRSIYIPPSK